MPTYEYACADCGAEHEAVQKMTDPALVDCPSCGAPALRKRFNNVGVVFKGSGFYRTDSRGSSAAKSSSDTASAAKDSGSTKSSDSGSSASTSSSASSSPSTTAAGTS